MDNFISVAFLVLTTIAYLVVAALASRGVSTKESYILGDRKFSVWSVTLTLIATQLGAGMFFGTAAESYDRGLLGIAYVLGMAIGLIILGLGVGARLRSLNITTTAELFETKYGSKSLRKYAAVISILTMGGILAAQIVASRQLFMTLFDLSPIWLVLFWIAIIAYTTFGGLKAIIATDMLQVFMIVVIFTTVLFYIVPTNEFYEVLTSQSATSALPQFDGGFFAALIATVLFSLIEQDLAQRCFAAKTRRVATISSLLAAAFLLVYAFVPIILGMYAKVSGITFVAGQSPLVLLFQAKLSSLGMTFVACALLAAICSTADSLLGAASSNLIADFAPKGKFSLTFSRLCSLMLGIAALIIAFNFDDVIGIIVKAYEISISALFVPLIIAMFAKNPSPRGATFSVITGSAVFLIVNIVGTTWSPTLIALSCSAAAFLLGALLGKKSINSSC